jgi:diguanylate cyclase (GGDEF)-like protein
VPLGEAGAGGTGADDRRVKAEALAEDAEGNLWVGTRQSGLFRLRAARFATRGTTEGLPHPFAFAVDGDGAGGAWIATQDGAVRLPARGAPVRMPALGDHVVRDVLRAPGGDVWLATTGGLTRLAGGRVDRAVTYTRRDGLADDRVRALAAGRGGVVWAATFDGVSAWHADPSAPRGGRLRRYGPADGLPDGYVLSVFEDRGGTLWVGTQSAGLFRCPPAAAGGDGGTADAARRCQPGPLALRRQPVFRLTEDPDGTLWAGTARGLARLRRAAPEGPATEVALVTPRHGLPGGTVFQALDDGRGALWLTGPWGIGRVARAALHAASDAAAAGRPAALAVAPFGRGDGMAAREASSISRAWRARDGTLWFPTPAGVAVVDPARLLPRSAPPGVQVEQVIADGVPTDSVPTDSVLTVAEADGRAGTPLALGPGTRTLELRVAAPSFTAPERVRLRWRLDGFDRAWVDGGARRAAYYTNLPPGRYRFRAQARAGDGPWGPERALALVLAPQPWQRPEVVGLAGLALAGATAAGYRTRVRTAARAAARRAARAAREEALRDASLRDELTGLYNRRGLLELAAQAARTAAREGHGFTLLFADLDGLKAINDALGHAAGDRAIADAAAVLRSTFREADVVARLGGDEFTVLLPEPPAAPGTPPAGAGGTAAFDAAWGRLTDALATHNAAAGRPYTLAMSAGASRFDPLAPRPIEALLADADRTMYAAKRARRATREMRAVAG